MTVPAGIECNPIVGESDCSQPVLDANNRFTFVYDDRIDIIRRTAMYTEETFVPVPAANNKNVNVYLGAVADKNGRLLEAEKAL